MRSKLYERIRGVERTEWLSIGGLAALAALCFFFRLGGVPLLGKDEPRYAEVAREMFVSGDWITPRLAGHAWFEKPALPYWTMAAGYEVLGVNELAARLGSALLAVVAVVVIYLMARRAFDVRTAVTASAVLITSGLWFAFARAAGFDIALAATMTAAIGCVFGIETATSRGARLGWAAAAGAWTGASMLAKGLAGPLLLGLIVGAYALATGAWRRWRARELLLATSATLAVAAVWYVPVWRVNGSAFIEEFFVNHHFRRYLTNKYHHPEPIWFYPAIVLAGLLPWTAFLFATARRFARALVRNPITAEDRLLWLALAWIVMPVAFFSLSTSKLPGYILPVFPALALLTAWAVRRVEMDGRGRWGFVATGVAVAALGVGLSVYADRSLHAPLWETVAVALPMVAACVVAIVAARRMRFGYAVWSVSAGMGAAVILVALLVFAELGHRESLAELSTLADERLRDGESIVMLGVVDYTPAFYAHGRMVVDESGEILIASSTDEVASSIERSPSASVLCVTDEARAATLESQTGLRVERLGSQRDRVLLRVSAG